jgi:hypothetical protein
MRSTEQAFVTALRETIAWSAPRIDIGNPRWCLRSEALRPPHDDWEENNPGLFNRPEYIKYVTTTRSRLLPAQALEAAVSNSAGRLLVVDYNLTNHNEATEAESSGFFDWADNPPWDLWVRELNDQLVCWIPAAFVDLVVRAMQVECVGMLHWSTPDNARLGRHPDWLMNYTSGG